MLKSSSQFFDLILKYSQKNCNGLDFTHTYYIEVASAEVRRHTLSIPTTILVEILLIIMNNEFLMMTGLEPLKYSQMSNLGLADCNNNVTQICLIRNF